MKDNLHLALYSCHSYALPYVYCHLLAHSLTLSVRWIRGRQHGTTNTNESSICSLDQTFFVALAQADNSVGSWIRLRELVHDRLRAGNYPGRHDLATHLFVLAFGTPHCCVNYRQRDQAILTIRCLQGTLPNPTRFGGNNARADSQRTLPGAHFARDHDRSDPWAGCSLLCRKFSRDTRRVLCVPFAK